MKKIAIVIDLWDKNILSKILFFLDHTFILSNNIKKFIDSKNDIDAIIIASYDKKSTLKSFLRWRSKAKKIFITEEEEIETLIKENHIEEIYMCGSAWDACVQNRPLGYLNLKRIVQKNRISTQILVKDNCVMTLNEKFFIPSENPDWIMTEEQGVYRYFFSR
jgi:hypothetical protein